MDWHLDDGDVRLALGDARERLREMPAELAQCLVTSPPFWSLRDYGTGRWEGGDPACSHGIVKLNDGPKQSAGQAPSGHASAAERVARTLCRCGAEKVEDRQIGLEETPEEWVDALVDVMREARRVLRKDGVAWLEVGDTYNAYNANRGASRSHSAHADPSRNGHGRGLSTAGAKNKDLVGAPWMLAFALRADGWYLRAENIWNKTNGMPESATDRPTRTHTQVFLLSRSARYFYDRHAVLEPHQHDGRKQTKVSSNGAGFSTHANYENRQGAERWPGAGRNLRSVWSMPTEATHHGHYAAFPEHLAARCILAGTSEHGACPGCGAPYTRVVDEEFVPQADVDAESVRGEGDASNGWEGYPRGSKDVKTLGWEPTCGCDAGEPVPQVVLDPFMGSGTTAVAARALGRHAVGVELSEEYLGIADERLRQLNLLT